MRRGLLSLVLLLFAPVALTIGAASAGDAPVPATVPTTETGPIDARQIVLHGKGSTVPACAACHGADGAGNPRVGFPRLAGLNATYLYRQLGDIASNTHAGIVMQPTARALSDAERAALAQYFSELPIPAALATPSVPMPSPDSVGAILATRGRWSQQLPACDQCHGPGGVGVGEYFPPLAGQPASYIVSQLQAWKTGKRHNDPLHLMQHVSQQLDDQDMTAVADWYAAQPLRNTGATP